MAGFTFRYRESGGAPTIQQLKFNATATLTKGDLLNLTTGNAALAAAASAAILGVALETKAGTAGVTPISVITDQDAVYGVVDNNARAQGDLLDLTGATGAQGVTTPTSNTLIVVAPSTATEETLVGINVGKSWLD